MVIEWQRVGFVHGVMNTDNMSILGLTIDYGPYGWLEGYDFGWTPNTTDSQFKRYKFGSQPDIVLWNLYKLANAIYPLIENVKGLESVLADYSNAYKEQYLNMMRSKLGLFTDTKNDVLLIKDLEENLQLTETDMTIFFRNLGNYKTGKPLEGLLIIYDAFYTPSDVTDAVKEKWVEWFEQYDIRLQQEQSSLKERKEKMNHVNPKYVLRNYMAQLAIDDANKGDYKLIDELFNMLKTPYAEQPVNQKWFAKRPDWARHKVGCSMLSCSS